MAYPAAYDHDVGADGCVEEERADVGEFLGVVPGAIAAIHAAQDGVGAGLEREVSVATETRAPGTGLRAPIVRSEIAVEGEQIRRPVHGLDGAEAEAREGGLGQDCGN